MHDVGPQESLRGLEARGLITDIVPEDELAGSPTHRRFVIRISTGLVFIVLAAFAFNLYADPLGTAGTGRYHLHPRTWLDRHYKMALVRNVAEAPEIVIYGTSTATDLPPEAIDAATDRVVFNASVSNGSPLDTYLFSSFVDQRFDEDPPQAIFALDVSAMQQVNPDPAILQDPDLRAQLPWKYKLRTVGQVYKPLFDLRRLPVSWRTFRSGIKSPPLPPVSNFYDQRGFSISPIPVVPTISAGDLKGIFKGLEEQTWRVGRFDHLDDEQLDLLDRFLEHQNDLGVTPVIYFSPLHPDPGSLRHGPRVAEYWADWHERHDELVDWLEDARKRHHFAFHDFTDISSIGGDPQGFRDELHMDVPNLALLVKELDERGAFDS